MLFASGSFIAFFLLLLLFYYLLPRCLQKPILLAGSLLFYLCSGWQNLLLILGMTLLSYGGARWIERCTARMEKNVAAHPEWDKTQRKAYRKEAKRRVRWRMLAVVSVLLLCLAFFKYAPSLIDLLPGGHRWDPVFPMGLSFFTFQVVGYVVDVYRGTVACEHSFFRFCLFSCYFPQLVQGPISRYGELSETLFSPRAFDGSTVASGLLRVCLGYIKKLVIADTAMIAVRSILEHPEEHRGGGVLMLLLLYSVQIYADFTGGMDIALGCSEMLGIRLTENFDHPFSSTTVKEYWRRWHISMGRWFTDYVFYPLSLCKASQLLSRFSRKLLGENIGKRIPVWTVTLITWILTGVWHGAGWNFVLWGLLNGLTILISQELSPLYRKLSDRFPRYSKGKFHRAMQCVRVFLLMGLYRTLDVYGNVGLTLRMWASLPDFSAWRAMATTQYWTSLALSKAEWGLLVLGVGMLYVIGKTTKTDSAVSASKMTGKTQVWGETLRKQCCRCPIRLALLLAWMISVVLIFGRYGFGYDATQFIYNQF